jgi:hypothetical protein
MEWLTHADFADRVGEVFEVPDAGLVLALVEATESSEPGGPGPDGRTRNQFSLVFTGPLDRAMGQGTVRVVHPELGEQHLFLVPLGPEGDTMRYEAAFA